MFGIALFSSAACSSRSAWAARGGFGGQLTSGVIKRNARGSIGCEVGAEIPDVISLCDYYSRRRRDDDDNGRGAPGFASKLPGYYSVKRGVIHRARSRLARPRGHETETSAFSTGAE